MRYLSKFLSALFLIVAQQISLAASTRWPAGTYGIPRALSGCPSSTGFTWRTGWRYQDTEDIFPKNQHSNNFHLDASVSKSNLKRTFCMKTDNAGSASRLPWPKGKYCIYKKGACPQGLKSGYITWDDEDWFNKNKKGGVLPDGVYNKNTKIFYCCKTDGNKTEPIELPTSKPFFLVAYESATCQQVKWALASTEWIRFDTEKDSDGYGGAYPYGAGLNDHTIHYCYYTSCNKTLTTSTGSFQSPNHPNPYPVGQYCSWKIKVPEGLQVVLKFPKFSLQKGTNTDNVQLYDGQNETSPSLGVYSGDMLPSATGVWSSSNMLFVIFKSDDKNSFTGFQATYTAQMPTQPPTTIKTTTTTKTTSPRTSTTSTTQNKTTTSATTTPQTTRTSQASSSTGSSTSITTDKKTTAQTTTTTTSFKPSTVNNKTTATTATTTQHTTGNYSIPSTSEVTSGPSERPTSEFTNETTTSGQPDTTIPTEPVTGSTKEPTHTKPTEVRLSTIFSEGNGSSYSHRKTGDESGSSSVVVVLVPLLCVLLFAVCVLMFFYYRRNQRRNETHKQNQSVYFESNPELDSMDNPLYESGVKIGCDPTEDPDPVYSRDEKSMVNPLYDTKAPITDFYAEPHAMSRPIMTLESDDVTEYGNPLYEAARSTDESSA